MLLTEKEVDTLITMLDAYENIMGTWPSVEKALSEAGYSDPEDASEAIMDKLRGNT